jgi:SAM-dependent methyltransferase
VIDVGCGRGLLAIGAARRLGPDGTVVGVDLWRAADLAGNHPAAAVENARKEAVSDRVRIVTGDMRALPLADRSVDVVLSSLAIHNVKGETGRTCAIAEIARVLQPGGIVVIQDLRNVQRAAELGQRRHRRAGLGPAVPHLPAGATSSREDRSAGEARPYVRTASSDLPSRPPPALGLRRGGDLLLEMRGTSS